MKINIKQYKKGPTRADIDRSSHLLIILSEPSKKRSWPVFPYADVLKQRLSRAGLQGNGSTLVCDLPNKSGTRVAVATASSASHPFDMLTVARKLASIQLEHNPRSLLIYAPGFDDATAARLAEALTAAVLACSYAMPSYKSAKKVPRKLALIELYGLEQRINGARIIAEAEGNNLARHLTSLPANELTPAIYRRHVSKLSREHGWKMRFFDVKTLKRKGAGAFLAVAQGSPEQDAGIVHLSYKPAKSTRKPALALVGKGICFDTGGTNLKPAKHMHGMHEDMQGSAVALGTLLALSRLKVPFPVDCWLALAQNHIGPRAYKQNDVVTASNGTTIEIVHTDAEGRMVLADTLAIAAAQKPGLIIDYATLTGTCVYALSSRYSGVFTNQPVLLDTLIEAGHSSGERVWPFPMDEDFDHELKSKIADIKQCSLAGEADHILAARFLTRFINKQPWIHVDLSAGNNKGGLAHVPTDITGFGVRFTVNLLLDNQVMGKIKP